MAEDSDGMNDAVEGQLRIAVTLAARAAEVLGQIVAERAREAAAASEAEGRRLNARLDAERAAARASVEGVSSDQWWARAQPEQIAAAWQATQTWKDVDPDLARKGEQIAAQLQARYGIDVDQVRPDPQALREAMARGDVQNLARASGLGAGRDATGTPDQRADAQKPPLSLPSPRDNAFPLSGPKEAWERFKTDRAWDPETSSLKVEQGLAEGRARAKVQVSGLDNEQWWAQVEKRDLREVVVAWKSTQSWRDFDPDLAAAGERIEAEVKARYGLDVAEIRPGVTELRERLAGHDVASSEAPNAPAAVRRREGLEAALLVAEADAADRGRTSEPAPSAEVGGEVAYDSDARRQAKQARLSEVADPETVRAVMLADLAQGRPAHEAVTTKTALGSQARPPRLAQDLVSEQVKTMGR